MQLRPSANTVFTTTTVFSRMASIVPAVLNLIGHVDSANSVVKYMQILPSLEINWQPVYLLLFIFSICSLFAANKKTWQQYRRKKWESQQRSWDISCVNVLRHICRDSAYRETIAGNTEEKVQIALRTLTQAVCDGRLIVAARPIDAYEFERISPKEWDKWEPRLHTDEATEEESMTLVDPTNGEVKYSGVMADKWEMRKLWPFHPKHPENRGW